MRTIDELDVKATAASENLRSLLGNGSKVGHRASDLSDAAAGDAEAIRSVFRQELLRARKEMAVEMQKENKAIMDATAEFKNVVAENIEAVRSFRMTVAREIATAITPLADVRKFFLGPDHVEEIRRIAEFVNVLERLDALKRSGFLDAVSETILRLDA